MLAILLLSVCIPVAFAAIPETDEFFYDDDGELHRNPVVDFMPEMPKDFRGAPLKNLTVFVLPHSHDDTGWQRTVDQYYEEEVRYIYDTVVAALRVNSQRKFVFVETAFFMRWWREQTPETQEATRALFAKGQLEFINGGWCMADDASPNTDAIIDQISLGHRYIVDTLGAQHVPKYAWHIDPFGLSASYSAFFEAMNYSAWIFNRIDTRLKDLWHNDTRLQFQWDPAGLAPKSTQGVFAHVLDTHYGSGSISYKGSQYHFDWEVFGGLGGGENAGSQIPVSDRNPSVFYQATAPAVAEAFVALAKIRAAWYKLGPPYQRVPSGTGVILVPFGDDMKFQNAFKQYSNMDRLIKAINSRFEDWGVHVQYGTMDDYFKLINTKQDWPTYDGDFMPLGTNNNIYTSQLNWNASQDNKGTDYWSGHYTTRPLMKSLVSEAVKLKHTSEIAATVRCAQAKGSTEGSSTPLGSSSSGSPEGNADPLLCGAEAVAETSDMQVARTVTSVLQHHDSITGTSNPPTALDLDVRLRRSIQSSTRVLARATLGDNVTDSVLLDGSNATVSLWNGMVHSRVQVVEVHFDPSAKASGYRVLDAVTQKEISSVVIPAVPEQFPFRGGKDSGAVLVFAVTLLPLSTTDFHLIASPSTKPQSWDCAPHGDVVIGATSGLTSVTFDGSSRRMKSIKTKQQNQVLELGITQQFAMYHSTGTSDAYKFLPNRTQFPFGESLQPLSPSLCVVRTPLVERVTQTYISATAHLREIVSVYPPASYPMVETLTQFTLAKVTERELITRYQTDINNLQQDGLPAFETDSNGYLMMPRVINRTHWVPPANQSKYYVVAKPVAGNYYPLSGSPGAIRIADSKASGKRVGALALLTDTAHGASALRRGWMEVMLGRHCAEKGGISVKDDDEVSLRNWLIPAASFADMAQAHRRMSAMLSTPVTPLVRPGLLRHHATQRRNGAPNLHPDLHLMSLDRIGVETTAAASSSRVLMRVQNIAQTHAGADADAIQFSVTQLLGSSGVCASAVTEVPLNGVARGEADSVQPTQSLTLYPLQIRSFTMDLRPCAGV